jgi:hypothetical protein
MGDTIIYETKGLRDAGASGFTFILAILACTGLIVTISSGQMIGPWYAYAGAIVVFSLITYLSAKQHSVIIQIIDKKDKGVFAAITGPDIRNNVTFRIDGYTHWYHGVIRPVSKGGPEARLHFFLTSEAGKHLHFKRIMALHEAPKNWKDENRGLPRSEASFIVDDLPDLANALVKFKE